MILTVWNLVQVCFYCWLITHIKSITSVSHFTQSSPPSLCAAGRTQDLQSILSVMEDAQSFIYIAVMNYLPTMEFSHPKRCNKSYSLVGVFSPLSFYQSSDSRAVRVASFAGTGPTSIPSWGEWRTKRGLKFASWSAAGPAPNHSCFPSSSL